MHNHPNLSSPASKRVTVRCRCAAPRRSRPAARAFTILELLVAAAALGLLTIGLVSIFRSVQDTVRSGQRVSRLTELSAVLRRRLENDISSITRDGFLVIINQSANNAAVVPLFPGQSPQAQRPRRIDELVFFSRGQFTGHRAPVIEDVRAEADTARIYIGHGQRRLPQPSPTGVYRVPTLDDPNDDPASALAANQPGNPNRYAQSWTLLRHETLLIEQRRQVDVPPSTSSLSALGLSQQQTLDSDIQIFGRPAASSIFRRLADVIPNPIPAPAQTIRSVRPRFSSGIVDAASTSLTEIRAIVSTVSTLPSVIADEGDLRDALLQSTFGPGSADLAIQQAWMLEALPTLSYQDPGASTAFQPVRMRVEPEPTDMYGALSAATPLLRAIRQADQHALGAASIIPNCSEFIVEFSFGDTYPTTDQQNANSNLTLPSDPALEGRKIWHGLTRLEPFGNGQILAACPFSDANSTVNAPNETHDYRVLYRLRTPAGPLPAQQFGEYAVPSTLIHVIPNPGSTVGQAQLVSTFGYINPVFTAPAGAAAADPSQSWPWPTQLRFIIRLADPDRPGQEDTLQFEFDLPPQRS